MFNNDYSMNDLDFGLIVSSMEGQITDDASGINISDVIEVIETDAAFGSMQPRRSNSDATPNGPYVKIIEQPASKALRFRYECEGRSAGSLPGVHSTPENKTFPTIQIANYKGRAVVVVSCVTKDPPYRPHPHNLVGKENCKRGVCTVEVNSDSMTASFANLGIQCVKKKDIEEALKVREEIRVDPFRTGFSHKTQASSIDLNSVRLCFQAFLEGPQRGKFTNPLTPVVSDPIYDKKAMADLVICKLSHCSASVAGGQEVILLCEKVAKEDISIRFFEEKEGHITWEGLADFTPNQVHKQTAISFRTPRYKSLEIENPVQAYIQLRRPSDGETSEALPFQITPLDSGRPFFWSLRRHKTNYLSFSSILHQEVKEPSKIENDKNNNTPPIVENEKMINVINQNENDIKVEMKIDPMKNVIVLPDTSGDGIDVDDDVNGNFEELLEHVNSLESIYPDNGHNEFGTYSSLQMAMKNPCEMSDTPCIEGYEDIAPPRPVKMSTEKAEEEAPPLPPKRAKKSPALPPPPHQNKNKLNLFQKLFSSTSKRKKKGRDSREGSIVSRISERSASLAPSTTSPVTQPNEVDLTEAEHYALYDSFAPRATASEFDEMSFYYSTVERQKVN